MEEFKTFFANALWLVIVFGALVGIFNLGKRGRFDKAKFSNDGTKYKFDQDNWRKYYPPLALVAYVVFAVVLVGCSASEPAAPAPVSNSGTYGGRFTSPDKRLCVDSPGLDPAGHGECGQRYTLEGNISFTVNDNTVTGGKVDFYGYSAILSAASPIDAQGNFTFSMAHANGKAQLVAGVLTGLVWEGPYEWKYGEYRFNKK